MTPVTRCLHKVDHASAVTDSTVAGHIVEALDELESAYRCPGDKIVALEEVLQFIAQKQAMKISAFGRFVCIFVERRQTKLARLTA